jgi:hypothetical protein
MSKRHVTERLSSPSRDERERLSLLNRDRESR